MHTYIHWILTLRSEKQEKHIQKYLIYVLTSTSGQFGEVRNLLNGSMNI